MTRYQRDAARTAGACFGILALCLLGVALCSLGGCAGELGPDLLESRVVEDGDTGAACPGASAPLRILPAGDSITCGTDSAGGYRSPLFAALGGQAVSVGTRDSATVCGGPGFHAGYNNSHTTGYAGYLPGFLTATRPDVLLLMLGTNGDGGGPEYVRDLLRPTLDAAPALRVLVGAIPAAPVQGDYPATFNASLAAALTAVPEYGTRLWYVPETGTAARADQFSADGLHPATAGYAAIADAWLVGMERAGLVQR